MSNVKEFSLIQTGKRTWKQLERFQGEIAWKQTEMAYGTEAMAIADTARNNEWAKFNAEREAAQNVASEPQEQANEAVPAESEGAIA